MRAVARRAGRRPGDQGRGAGAQPYPHARRRRGDGARRFDVAHGLARARARHSDGARRARCDAPDSGRRAMCRRRRRRHRAVAALMAKPRIFVTQPVCDSAIKRLRALGSVKVYPDDSRIIPHKTLVQAVKKTDILFCLLHDKIDRAVVAANPKLGHIAAQSISPSNIDVAEATRLGIPVTVVPPVTTEATADLTLGLMLAVGRRMVEGDGLVRKGKFPGGQSRHLLGSYVWGKTIGLIGGGGLIGKAVA